MTRIELSLALRTNARVQPLVDNPHAVEGVELRTSLLPPADTFWRQLRFQDFDISEMSLAQLARLNAQGDKTWVAIPVFPDRRFFHAAIMVRADSDIRTPEQLRGCNIGTADYPMTGAVWARGILEHDYGVRPADMSWFQERTPELSHGGATRFQPPADVRIQAIPTGDSQRQMFHDGRLDASILFITYRTMLDRSFGPVTEANVRPLFPDDAAEKARAYAKWGFLPFNHCMVIRRSLVEQHPWLALNVYKGFLDAKKSAHEALVESVRPHYEAGLLGDARIDEDLFPYGVPQNSRGLDTLFQFLAEQGVTDRRLTAADIFEDRFLDL